jgi:hypothetical protein
VSGRPILLALAPVDLLPPVIGFRARAELVGLPVEHAAPVIVRPLLVRQGAQDSHDLLGIATSRRGIEVPGFERVRNRHDEGERAR